MAMPHPSPAQEAGDTFCLSGPLAFDAEGGFPHDDIAGQTDQMLRNIAGVLAQSRLMLRDVVKTSVWLRDAADFSVSNGVYAQAFGGHRPARSTVISVLVVPQARVEMEAIAV